MNDIKATIIKVLGEFAEGFDIDGIDMALYKLGLTVESDEFWDVVAEFDMVAG